MLKTAETKEQCFKVTIHHHCFGVHINSPTWIFSVFILIYINIHLTFFHICCCQIPFIPLSCPTQCGVLLLFFLVLWSKWGLSGKCMVLLGVFLFCFSFCFACCILICAYPPRVWQWCSSFCLIGVLWSSQRQCCGNHHCQPLIFVPCLHYSSSLSPACHIGSFFYARWYSARLHVNAKDISIVVLCHSSFYYIALQMLSYLCFSWFCLHGFWSSCFCAWVLLQWLTCAVYIYMYWCFLRKNIFKMIMIEDDFEDRFVNCIDKN